MKNKNIIMIAQQPWDTKIGTNVRNMAEEMARENNVLFINMPLNRKTLYKKRHEEWVQDRIAIRKGEKSQLEQVHDQLWVYQPTLLLESINWIKSEKAFNWANKVNNKRMANAIKKAARMVGFDEFVLFNDSAMFEGRYLKTLVKPSQYIYYVRDYLIEQSYFKRHGGRCEGELMEEADAIVANSVYLRDYAAKFNPNAHYIGQGCEIDLFEPSLRPKRPEDLAAIRGPIIGYMGTITSMRLDVEVLDYIAKELPGWNLVMVGPIVEAQDFEPLRKYENVHFLGSKPVETLANYVEFMDVCINPQAINPLTVGNYPRKVDEYLAMGKPVIATATEAMQPFKDHVYLAESKDAYVEQIKWAVREDSETRRKERRAFAQGHTWEQSVKDFYLAVAS